MAVLIVLAAGAGLGAAALRAGTDAPAARSEQQVAALGSTASTGPVELADIEVTTVEPRTVSREIRVSGVLGPVRRASLNAKVGGTVQSVAADVGDRVASGDVLVELDSDILEAALEARRANVGAFQAQLSLAQSTLNRSQRLGQSGIASEASLLEAEAQVANFTAQLRGAQAELRQAEIQLSDAVVRAPFDGVVSVRSVEPGQTISANSALLSLVDLSAMEIDAAVPTSRIAAVEVGQTASMSTDGLTAPVEARVVRISPVAESGSRAVRVFLRVDNAEGRLRGGMFASGQLQVEEAPDVIALPASAIRRDADGAFVLKAVDGRLARQTVEIGRAWSDRGLTEITTGLEPGDVVVTAPLPDLVPDVDIRFAEL